MTDCQRHCLTAPVASLHVAIVGQLVFALLVEHGEFVRSEDVLISPFHFCMRRHDGEMKCQVASTRSVIRLLQDLLVVCVYAPVVLMLYATVAYLFAVFYADSAVLLCSVVCQVVSCGVMLFGLTSFLATYWSHVQVAGLSLSFYFSACSCVEMAAATVLSWLVKEGLEHGKDLGKTLP